MKQVFAANWLLGAGSPPALSVQLAHLRNDTGQVGCALYSSEKGFPGDAAAAAKVSWCDISEREATCVFDGVATGIYAVVCFHDENGDKQLATGLFGLPSEGIAVSNHASVLSPTIHRSGASGTGTPPVARGCATNFAVAARGTSTSFASGGDTARVSTVLWTWIATVLFWRSPWT